MTSRAATLPQSSRCWGSLRRLIVRLRRHQDATGRGAEPLRSTEVSWSESEGGEGRAYAVAREKMTIVATGVGGHRGVEGC